jgi:hypothetical protein
MSITERVKRIRDQSLAVGDLEAELRLVESLLDRYPNKYVFQWFRDVHRRLIEQGASYSLVSPTRRAARP